MKIVILKVENCLECPRHSLVGNLRICLESNSRINYHGVRTDCPLKDLTDIQIKAIEQISGRKI